MLTKRIVAALDIKEGRVVKGVQFENIQDAGDPVQLAKKYEKDGVDLLRLVYSQIVPPLQLFLLLYPRRLLFFLSALLFTS